MAITINGGDAQEMSPSQVFKIGILFACIGLACLIGGGLWAKSNLDLSRNGIKASATILKRGPKGSGSSGTLCSPTISFSEKGKTTTYTFRSANTAYCFKAGEVKEIYYLRKASGKLSVDFVGAASWTFPLIFLFLGTIFFLLGALTTKVGWSAMRKEVSGEHEEEEVA